MQGGRNGAAGGELQDLAASVHSGLRSLHVLSNTGRGREMSAARGVVQRAWRERARVFSAPQVAILEGWAQDSRNFAALLDEGPGDPAPVQRRAMPAPAPEAVPVLKRAGGGLQEGHKGAGAQSRAHNPREAAPALVRRPEAQPEARVSEEQSQELGERLAAAVLEAKGIPPGSPVDTLLRWVSLQDWMHPPALPLSQPAQQVDPRLHAACCTDASKAGVDLDLRRFAPAPRLRAAHAAYAWSWTWTTLCSTPLHTPSWTRGWDSG